MERSYELLIEKAKELDWNVKRNGQFWSFYKFSPAGQDWGVEINANEPEEIINSLNERCENFDCSEETYYWLDNTGHGANGAPYDMRDVYNDMEACLEMMEELRDALEDVLEQYELGYIDLDEEIKRFETEKQSLNQSSLDTKNVENER